MGFSRQEHWSELPFPAPKGTIERKKVKSLSHVWLFVTPWTVAYQAPPSMEFSRQEYWSWVPFPAPPGFIGFCLISVHCGPIHSSSLFLSFLLCCLILATTKGKSTVSSCHQPISFLFHSQIDQFGAKYSLIHEESILENIEKEDCRWDWFIIGMSLN